MSDYDDATWQQDLEEIEQWIEAGCPWPLPGSTRNAVQRQRDWLNEVWRKEMN